MAAACAAVVIGALLVVVYVVDRIVDGVEHHVEEHTDSSSATAAQLSWSSAASWRRSATADDVTADMWPARSPIIGT